MSQSIYHFSDFSIFQVGSKRCGRQVQLFYRNIFSKMKNKVTKRKEASLIMLKLREAVAA
jgi:hypothetical protein